MQNQMIENFVQFTHLEKLYGYLPGMDEALMAQLAPTLSPLVTPLR